MTLSTGARLGPYEVLSPLGAGGMGEVYRARDTRLGREVAIKVLPAALGSDPERLKRFEREARSASALNHPNIVTIYDIGSADSVSYIAMELVSGQPLRAVLAEGALPTKRLLQIGTQIAEGLAKAHAAGIVHRDLKPENVMVTEDGLVKILDFGLAKLTQPDTSGGSATMAPTVSGATEEGIILGTVGYMSPEQATGGAIDFRSDQFSFGSILYEMATGRRPFVRGSAPETLAAIIRDEPHPIAELNPTIPAPLRWIIERCLAKEAKKRFASTEDLASDLATIRDHLSEATRAIGVLPAEAVPPPKRRGWIPAVVAAAILLTLGIAGWRLSQRDYFWKNPLAGARFTRLTDWEGPELNAAISRDGKFVVFLSDRDGQFDAWVTQVGSGEFVNLTRGRLKELLHEQVGTVGFSEDNAHVWLHYNQQDDDGVIRSKGIWLVPTMGGALNPFLTGKALQASWSPDGNRLVYFNGDPGDPIFVADRNGGNPRRIFVDKPGIHCHFPTWSPDGQFIYFVRGTPWTKDLDIWRVPSAGGQSERITNQQSVLAYPTLLDARTLLYVGASENGLGLWSVDVERRIPHRVSFGLEEYLSVSASADGRRLAATVGAISRNLWTVPISARVLDESSVARFAIPAVRAAAPTVRGRFALLPFLQRRFQRALEVQGRRRRGDLAAGSRRRSVGAGDLFRREANLLSRQAGGAFASVRRGVGWHERSASHAIARGPGLPVLVARREMDPRRVQRGDCKPALEDTGGRWRAGPNRPGRDLEPRLVSRRKADRLYRLLRRKRDVPGPCGHLGRPSGSTATSDRPRRRRSVPVSPRRKGARPHAGRISEAEFLALRLRHRASPAADEPPGGRRDEELRRLSRRKADPLRPLPRELRHRPDRSAAAVRGRMMSIP